MKRLFLFLAIVLLVSMCASGRDVEKDLSIEIRFISLWSPTIVYQYDGTDYYVHTETDTLLYDINDSKSHDSFKLSDIISSRAQLRMSQQVKVNDDTYKLLFKLADSIFVSRSIPIITEYEYDSRYCWEPDRFIKISVRQNINGNNSVETYSLDEAGDCTHDGRFYIESAVVRFSPQYRLFMNLLCHLANSMGYKTNKSNNINKVTEYIRFHTENLNL